MEARAMVRARKYGVHCPTVYFVDLIKHKIYMEYITGVTLDQFLNKATTHRSDSKERTHECTPSCCNEFLSEEYFTYTSSMFLLHFFGCNIIKHKIKNVVSQLARKIGQSLAKLHNSGCIHGDITPCNILIHFPKTKVNNGIENKPMEFLTVVRGNVIFHIHLILSIFVCYVEVYIDFGLSSMSCTAENRAVDLYVLERALKTYTKAFPDFVCYELFVTECILYKKAY
jgi:tRNA A-37 threonylcarbamoyl transferase component Bud32